MSQRNNAMDAGHASADDENLNFEGHQSIIAKRVNYFKAI